MCISCKIEGNFKPFSSVCLVQINIALLKDSNTKFWSATSKSTMSTLQKWSKSCSFHSEHATFIFMFPVTNEEQFQPTENHPFIQLQLHIQVIPQNYWMDTMPLSRTKASSCQSKSRFDSVQCELSDRLMRLLGLSEDNAACWEINLAPRGEWGRLLKTTLWLQDIVWTHFARLDLTVKLLESLVKFSVRILSKVHCP